MVQKEISVFHNSLQPCKLRNEVVKGIGKGEFEIGESLPTVRQMAMELGVNTMTVSLDKTFCL